MTSEGSVSYTHLDVYKRQVLPPPPQSLLVMTMDAMLLHPQPLLVSLQPLFLQSHTPLSPLLTVMTTVVTLRLLLLRLLEQPLKLLFLQNHTPL